MNLFDQEDGVERHARQGEEKGDDTFGQGELVFAQVLVSIFVFMLVFFKNRVVDAMVCTYLKVDIASQRISLHSPPRS